MAGILLIVCLALTAEVLTCLMISPGVLPIIAILVSLKLLMARRNSKDQRLPPLARPSLKPWERKMCDPRLGFLARITIASIFFP